MLVEYCKEEDIIVGKKYRVRPDIAMRMTIVIDSMLRFANKIVTIKSIENGVVEIEEAYSNWIPNLFIKPKQDHKARWLNVS